jgi:hypothetical protein
VVFFCDCLAAFTLTQFLRTIAKLVLLFSALQIAMCAVDCECFLPAPAGISSHATDRGDADGCLCCAQCGQMPGLWDVPRPLQAQFVRSPLALRIAETYTIQVYRPPRS